MYIYVIHLSLFVCVADGGRQPSDKPHCGNCSVDRTSDYHTIHFESLVRMVRGIVVGFLDEETGYVCVIFFFTIFPEFNLIMSVDRSLTMHELREPFCLFGVK